MGGRLSFREEHRSGGKPVQCCTLHQSGKAIAGQLGENRQGACDGQQILRIAGLGSKIGITYCCPPLASEALTPDGRTGHVLARFARKGSGRLER